MGQTLQSAYIRSHPDIDLLDAEIGIRRAQPNIAGRDEIYAAADAGALYGSDDRNAATVDHGKALLHVEHAAPQPLAAPTGIAFAVSEGFHDTEFEAGSEVAAGRGDDSGAHRRIAVDGVEHRNHVTPERQNHGVERLRPVESDMRDVIFDRKGQGLIGHAGSTFQDVRRRQSYRTAPDIEVNEVEAVEAASARA